MDDPQFNEVFEFSVSDEDAETLNVALLDGAGRTLGSYVLKIGQQGHLIFGPYIQYHYTKTIINNISLIIIYICYNVNVYTTTYTQRYLEQKIQKFIFFVLFLL